MSTPADSKRRHQRKSFKRWLDVAFLNDANECVEFICTPSADISEGGCGIMTAEPYEVGDRVLLRIGGRREGEEPWLCFGEVRHVHQPMPNGWWVIGFQFTQGDMDFARAFNWGQTLDASHSGERRHPENADNDQREAA